MNLSVKRLQELIDFQTARIEFREKHQNVVDVRDKDILYVLKNLDYKIKKNIKEVNIGFDTFCFAYGKKVDREESKRLWFNLTDEEREIAIAHIPKWLTQWPDKQYLCSPRKYLLRKKFYDEVFKEAEKEVKNEVKKETWLKGTE
jgi:hypothetical protein